MSNGNFNPEDLFKPPEPKEALSKYTIDLTARALAEAGYDETFGARPLKRLIQDEILDPLALLMIEGKVKTGEKVKVNFINGKISL